MDAITETRHLVLCPYREPYLERLYAMHGNPLTQHLWSPGVELHDFAYFKSKLTRRIAHRWDHYQIFQHRGSGEILGFAYCYNGNEPSRTTCVCLYLDHPYLGSVLCLEAAYMYLHNLFTLHAYRKVYAEIFAYNTRALGLVRKTGFSEEGCLRDHQLWNGRYWDQYIFALTRQQWLALGQEKPRLLQRLTHE